jgi:hypothetical protein
LTCSRTGIKLVMFLVAGPAGPAGRPMAMSNRYARVLAVAGAAVLMAALSSPAALAGGTWTIQPGGGIQAASSGRVTLTDTTTQSLIYCVRSTASGTLKSGSGLPGSAVGSLSAVSFPSCTFASPLVVSVDAGGLPWQVNLSSYNTAEGVVRGTISHVHLTLSGSGCTARIDHTGSAGGGRVAFRYIDSTGVLTVLTRGSSLRFHDVSSGCLGEFTDGDPATISAAYTVTPEQAITSP